MDVLGRSLPRAEPLLKLTGLDLQEGAEEAEVGEHRLEFDKALDQYLRALCVLL